MKPENNQQNQQNVSLPQQQSATNVQVQTQTSGVPAKVDVKNKIGNLKEKFNSYSKNTRILIVVIAVMFVVIILLSIMVMLFGKKSVLPTATPTPSPVTASPAPNVILNASRYATDSGVLKIESDLQAIQKQLDGSDVKETDLSIPNLDFNINFNK